MHNVSCLAAVLMASVMSCTTLNTNVQPAKSLPGQVGVVSTIPQGFRPVKNPDSPAAVYVSLDIPATIEVTELPLPPPEKPTESAHLATMDVYAKYLTRDPNSTLVSAQSLFWNDDTHTGAFEVIHTEPSQWPGQTVPHIMRVVRVTTNKGSRAIALRKHGEAYDSFNAAWAEILAHICVEEAARIARD